MANAWKQYAKEMAKKFGYLATWEPGSPLRLGDVGIIKRNLFVRIGSLEGFGLSFGERPDAAPVHLSHASSGKVTITFKAAGKPSLPGSVLKEAQAGVTIDFKKENATVFEAANCTTTSIENQIELGKQIRELYAGSQWNKDWVVITELIRAGSATILISAARNAKVEISAGGAVAAAGFNLGEASAGLTLEFLSNMHTKIVAESGQSLTPLFRARGLKSSQPVGALLGTRRLTAIDVMRPADALPHLEFGPIEYDDSLDALDVEEDLS